MQAIEGAAINPIAKDLKISSVDTVFRQLLDINKDEPDPWSSAVSMYYAAKIREAVGEESKYDTWNSLLPFTLSGSKNNPDKLAGLAGVSASDNFTKWFFSDEYKDLKDLPGGKESIYWLAPRQGEFTWQSWGIIKTQLGLKIDPMVEESLEALFAAQGQYNDTQIRKTYDQAISQLDITDPEQRKLINDLNKQKSDARSANERRNPYWNTLRAKGGTDYNQTRLSNSVKQMQIFIQSVKDSGRKLPKSLQAIELAITTWSTYSEAIKGLGQKKAELQLKAELMADRDKTLGVIASDDENAKRFIDTVLDTLNYGEYQQMNPNLVMEEVQ